MMKKPAFRRFGGVPAGLRRALVAAALASIAEPAAADPAAEAQRQQACRALVAAALAAIAEAAAADPAAEAQRQQACREASRAVLVEVGGVRSARGAITAYLFDEDPARFLRADGGIDKTRVAAAAGRTELCLLAPQAGSYAVALYHDEDGDGDFDRNFLGLPLEGYGFSRNPGFAMSPPDYEEIAFRLGTAPVALAVSLRYLVE